MDSEFLPSNLLDRIQDLLKQLQRNAGRPRGKNRLHRRKNAAVSGQRLNYKLAFKITYSKN